MHYECEHGCRVLPRPDIGPKALEACPDCPPEREKVRYAPVWAPGEGENVQTQLRATMLFWLRWCQTGPGDVID